MEGGAKRERWVRKRKEDQCLRLGRVSGCRCLLRHARRMLSSTVSREPFLPFLSFFLLSSAFPFTKAVE